MTQNINGDEERDVMAVLDERTLDRISLLQDSDWQAFKAGKDARVWEAAYAAYVLACKWVDVQDGELMRKFNDEYVGEAGRFNRAGRLLTRINRRNRLYGWNSSRDAEGQLIRRAVRGDGLSDVYAVVTEHRIFVFERSVPAND